MKTGSPSWWAWSKRTILGRYSSATPIRSAPKMWSSSSIRAIKFLTCSHADILEIWHCGPALGLWYRHGGKRGPTPSQWVLGDFPSGTARRLHQGLHGEPERRFHKSRRNKRLPQQDAAQVRRSVRHLNGYGAFHPGRWPGGVYNAV